jgi:hypothetical protein
LAPSDTLLQTIKQAVEAHLALLETTEQVKKKIKNWNLLSMKSRLSEGFCPFVHHARKSVMIKDIGIRLSPISAIIPKPSSVIAFVQNVPSVCIPS